ncbi:MAG: HEPN domain-containing protein [Candidatus Aminicenantes bacterium]|nr:HEPN domain-containing protein [Candidatus Aminicenantes bacterium]
MNWEKDLINYRREKAAEAIEDATILFEKKRLSAAVNRIYYAMFYEISALLLSNKFSSSKHSGIRSLFNEHFVKRGVVEKETGKFFSKMFDFRQKGDYADFIRFEESEVFEWLEKAKENIKKLENILINQKK